MQFEEKIPRQYFSRKEMAKRVARFSALKGSDGGLPDSYHPSAERLLYNVIGFQPPPDEAGGLHSPVGAEAARMAAVKISEGFNLGFCRALPGKGPMMHNHDTNETFVCITGTWRASWEQPNGKIDYFDLEPLDVISFPPGCIRRFVNVTKGSKNVHSTLLFVISGDAPQAEFSKEAMTVLAAAGLLADKPVRKAKTVSTKAGQAAARKAPVARRGAAAKPVVKVARRSSK